MDLKGGIKKSDCATLGPRVNKLKHDHKYGVVIDFKNQYLKPNLTPPRGHVTFFFSNA